MKIAGRKNDGAWYRANKMIKGLESGEKTALATTLAGLDHAVDYMGVIQDFYTAAGLSGDADYPTEVAEMTSNYTQVGIPRQVWMGQLSYDTYDRTGEPGGWTYTPRHRATAFNFGKEIRKAVRDFTFARRQARDLTNVAYFTKGNPGGRADATKDTLPEGP